MIELFFPFRIADRFCLCLSSDPIVALSGSTVNASRRIGDARSHFLSLSPWTHARRLTQRAIVTLLGKATMKNRRRSEIDRSHARICIGSQFQQRRPERGRISHAAQAI
jgi:hypothetical protein